MITLTAQQIMILTKVADTCFMQGYTSTQFARTLAHDAFMIGVDIPSEDDFYNMTCGNQPMKSILLQLGYVASSYGYGILKNKPCVAPTYGRTNESTWK